jgi:hypothetical protein
MWSKMLHGNKVAARAKCQLAKEIMVSNVLMSNSIGTRLQEMERNSKWW